MGSATSTEICNSGQNKKESCAPQAPLFHLLMWSVTAAGVAFLLQSPQKFSEARWLAIVCAVVWVGYNVFLVIIYITVMSVSDAHGAADYWRYTPHAALLGLYVPAMALVALRRPSSVNSRVSALVIAVVFLALCALPMRSDFRNSVARMWQAFLRNAVAEMRPLIPPGSKIAIVSFSFPDASPFGVAVRYYLWQLDRSEQQFSITIRWDDGDLANLTTNAATDYLVIQDAQSNMDETSDLLGLPRLHHELALFAWRNGAWDRVKSWPIALSLIHR